MAYILIIEDDPSYRHFLAEVLEDAGHEVRTAADGVQGIALYHERPANLVITDIFMPNKEGLETSRELKSEYPDAKIVAITGGGAYTMFDSLKWVLAMGVDKAFLKPVDPDELLQAVDELLNGS